MQIKLHDNRLPQAFQVIFEYIWIELSVFWKIVRGWLVNLAGVMNADIKISEMFKHRIHNNEGAVSVLSLLWY